MWTKKTAQRRRNGPKDNRLRAAVRSAERRRAVRQRVGWLSLLLVGLPALAYGLYLGGGAAWRGLFAENDFFQIRQIEVTTDGALGSGHIHEYGNVRPGMNLFAVRPRDIRESLLRVPVIANAQVGRRLPDTLVIEVTERVAVARLGHLGAGSPLAVDAEGHVLGPSSVRASLPVIVGIRDKGLRPGDQVGDPMLSEALEVLEICNQSAMRRELTVATVDVSSEDQMGVGLTSGEQVLLSRGRLDEKLRQLPIMRAVARQKGLALAVYDMTTDRNYAGRPADWSEESAEAPR